MKERLDKYFKISERGSTVSTEIIGGATTFATMAYILAYMTWSMSTVPGINLTGVLVCTALTTAISCFAMGLYSNTPICLAPVLVIPGLIAGWIADGTATYSVAFGLVFVSGVIFLLISLFNLRELFAKCLPKNVKIGIAAAVGFLIARVGLGSCGLYSVTDGGFTYGDFSSNSTILGIIGVAICFFLTYVKIKVNGHEYKIRGGLLIGIIITTIIGIPMGVTILPETIFTSGAFSAIGDVAFQVDILGALKLSYIPLLLMLIINDFFGTLGAGLALAGKANLLDEDGNFPAFGKVFLVDSGATILGAIFGISTISSFAESAAGIESGSRTGLSNVSTAVLFLLCCFISPVFQMIPGAATGAALVVVGISLLETVKGLDFDPVEFLPVACMWLVTIYMSDYVGGIVIGMFVYVFISVLRAICERDVKLIPSIPVWIMTALMCLYYIF
ncbi:MAG: NCS2 family permease [Candidatus Metalachnospira sp.]|nr:NCS2 family permease [Candidatus Metalachnospira sp.]